MKVFVGWVSVMMESVANLRVCEFWNKKLHCDVMIWNQKLTANDFPDDVWNQERNSTVISAVSQYWHPDVRHC